MATRLTAPYRTYPEAGGSGKYLALKSLGFLRFLR
jgi:hypothetical protein